MNGTRYWGDVARPKTKTEFFNAVTAPAPEGDATVATIRLYGPIDSYGGWWGISAKEVGQVLDALPATVGQIILRINSPGGEVFEGVSILNMLRAHRATITAVVDGRACSAASVIAAGCDDVVMSPATQMMIHSPWSIGVGNATEMRKLATMLDGVESSMVEIYTAKAGEKDWAQLLADETWLTGPQAVELGLADRVAIVPDAGEAETVGEEPIIITVTPIEDDDVDDAAAPLIAARVAASIKPPSSSEPGNPNRKEPLMASDAFLAGVRDRVGISDAEASEETVLAALDETLAEQADTSAAPAAALPDGVVAIDATVLAELRENAAAGAAARADQTAARRDGIIADALRTGRITAASQAHFRALLEENEDGTVAVLNSLAENAAVPTSEVGHSDTVNSADDALYAQLFGAEKGA